MQWIDDEIKSEWNMINSPLIRMVAALTAAIPILLMLLPDQARYLYVPAVSATVLTALYLMACIGRMMPVFDDRAFYRTLPISRWGNFMTIVRMPMLVVAVVLAGGGVFIWFHNLSVINFWRIVMTVPLPLMLIMALGGVAASIGSSRWLWNILIWAEILGSLALGVFWVRIIPTDVHVFFLSPTLKMVAVGALYFPILWLVVAGRRKILGLGLAIWTSFLIPWLGPEVSRIPIPRFSGMAADQFGQIEIIRKTGPENRPVPPGAAVDQVMAMKGVKPGELLVGSIRLGDDPFENFFRASGIELMERFPDIPNAGGDGPRYPFSGTLLSDGTSVWGKAAQLEVIKAALPEGVKISHWEPKFDKTLGVYESVSRNEGDRRTSNANEEIWSVTASLQTMGVPVIFEPLKGGKIQLPWGGSVEMKPLQKLGGDLKVELSVWNSGSIRGYSSPSLVVVDDKTGAAFYVDSLRDSFQTQGIFWPEKLSVSSNVSDPDLSKKRVEILKRGRIYIFWPETRSLGTKILPPPQ